MQRHCILFQRTDHCECCVTIAIINTYTDIAHTHPLCASVNVNAFDAFTQTHTAVFTVQNDLYATHWEKNPMQFTITYRFCCLPHAIPAVLTAAYCVVLRRVLMFKLESRVMFVVINPFEVHKVMHSAFELSVLLSR